jgi:cbb3-type cytochrome oxidase subunit 3
MAKIFADQSAFFQLAGVIFFIIFVIATIYILLTVKNPIV